MKIQNTTFSFFRHLLTTVGGVLAASPEPTSKAIGIVLAAVGAAWGMYDEHKAENPSGMTLPPPSGGAAVSLLLCAILGMGLGLGVSGCATVGTNPDKSALQEQAAYTGTKTAVLIVLQNEPQAEAALTALASGVDTVFTTGALTPAQLKAALDALKVQPRSQLLIASALNDAYALYTAATGQKVVITTDPTAAAILRGVKRGITDGIAFAHAFAAQP